MPDARQGVERAPHHGHLALALQADKAAEHGASRLHVVTQA
ncbi:MAG TPA: hypothetical protein VN649_10565 [Ramlibacter sp.]|nr:hypothetical protein [Ramlibacter sp.]